MSTTPAPQTGDTATTTTVDRRTFTVTIEVVTEIEAPADAVWSVLTEFGRYREWNPFITSLEGTLEVGQRLTAVLAPDGGQGRTMRPRVTDVAIGRSFGWLGRVGIPGVLDGRHHFELQPVGADRTRFVHHERLSGMLVPMFRRLLVHDTPIAFAAMNSALAERAAARG